MAKYTVGLDPQTNKIIILDPGEAVPSDLMFTSERTREEMINLGIYHNPDDKLGIVNYLQSTLNERVNAPGQFREFETEEDMAKWILRWSQAIAQENSELVDSCPWKWWKKMDLDYQNCVVEAIDMLHFLMSLFQTLGLTPDMVLRAYIQKNMVNHQRQDQPGGYTKENKDEEDSRHVGTDQASG